MITLVLLNWTSNERVDNVAIQDIIIEAFEDSKTGEKYSRVEIIEKVKAFKDIPEGSIIPSDYCYNRTNLGIFFEKQPHIFILHSDGIYEYVGQNYNYTGDIIHRNSETNEEKLVGKWVNGKPEFFIPTVASIWVAAAVLAYNKFYNSENISDKDMYFKQSDIIKQAEIIHGCKVPAALASSHCVSNSNDSQYNYLVGGTGDNAKYRRLSFKNEYNGEKERPELSSDIIVKTYLGEKTMQEIYEFVDNEYTKIFSTSERDELLTTCKCKSILEYLKNYAGKPYTSPEKAKPEELEELNLIKEAGGAAIKELDKMARLCEIDFGLKKYGNSRWLDGSNTRAREYLWRQMKLPGYEESPVSISLFAEIAENKQTRFRFSVEINEQLSTPENYKQYHRILNRDISMDPGLVYYVLDQNNSFFVIQPSSEGNEEVKKKVLNGTYKRAQVSSILTYDEIEKRMLYDKDIMGEMVSAIKKLLPYYKLAIEGKNSSNTIFERDYHNKMLRRNNSYPSKNIILYGPPGTGKTYSTVLYAVSLCDGIPVEELQNKPYETVLARYNELKNNEHRIAFTTFHQSYGYEEFIEGIRPVLCKENVVNETSDIQYEFSDGIFKYFCEKAKAVTVQSSNIEIRKNPTVWHVLLDGSGESDLKKKCFENNYIKIGWSKYDEIVTEQTPGISDLSRKIVLNFQDEMEIGDIVFVQKNKRTIDGIGIITGEYKFIKEDGRFPRTRSVRWVAKGINEDVYELNKNTYLDRKSVYPLKNMDIREVIKLIEKYTGPYTISVKENTKPYVFIIDEINRGNISKIFGELITLIEETKRIGEKEAVMATLPYTKKPFGVPNNVYILGTMNTADRSIALLDTALRRRFNFIEMMPDTSVFTKLGIHKINDIDIPLLLDTINKRIELLYDREHTIGHAYFTSFKKDPSLKNLAEIFLNKIIPLLQEYFFEDYSKIQLILGDNAKTDNAFKFILDEEVKVSSVFKGTPDIDLPEKRYRIQTEAFFREESYKQVY